MNKQNRCQNRQNHLRLSNMFRQLWQQHVQWTRAFIISTAHELPDLEAVTHRLLRNPSDFMRQLQLFYGDAAAGQFQKLLEEHLLVGAALVNAAKAGDLPAADEARARWYHNADELAALLARMNPHWDEQEWKQMFYEHLAITEREAVLRLNGNFADDVALFDEIENQAMRMADLMTRGTARSFTL